MRFAIFIGTGLALLSSVVLFSQQKAGSLASALPHEVKMEFVRIEAGQFMMGCSAGDDQCADNERPSHLVKITRAFEIGKYEVTSEQWQVIMNSAPIVTYKNGDLHAVDFAGWTSAQ